MLYYQSLFFIFKLYLKCFTFYTFITELPRPKKRITELLLKSAQSAPSSQEKARQDAASGEWHLDFFRSPSEVLSSSPSGENGRVAGVRFDVCKLEVRVLSSRNVLTHSTSPPHFTCHASQFPDTSWNGITRLQTFSEMAWFHATFVFVVDAFWGGEGSFMNEVV